MKRFHANVGARALARRNGGPPLPKYGTGVVTTLVSGGLTIPKGVARLPDGNLVVCDTFAHRIVVVTYPGGAVTLLAGSGTASFADGTGSAASFRYPTGVVVVNDGNIVVSDTQNNLIRLITYPGGIVTTIAGTPGTGGAAGTSLTTNGIGTSAAFISPQGMCVNPAGDTIYIGQGASGPAIRRMTYPGASVTKFAGAGAGDLGTIDGPGAIATFLAPIGITYRSDGGLAVVDLNNNRLRLIAPDATVTTLLSSGLTNPGAIISLSNDTIFAVCDTATNRILLVSNPGGVIGTLAGSTTRGTDDGVGTNAKFYTPYAITLLPDGKLVVLDSVNGRIRIIT